jgi:hypothetical protein
MMMLTHYRYRLIGAIRKKYPDLPIHVHSHDTAGIAAATMIAAAVAGADVVDVAIDSEYKFTASLYLIDFLCRHVWYHIAAVDGCGLHGTRANHARNGDSLCRYSSIELVLDASEANIQLFRSQCSRLRFQCLRP